MKATINTSIFAFLLSPLLVTSFATSFSLAESKYTAEIQHPNVIVESDHPLNSSNKNETTISSPSDSAGFGVGYVKLWATNTDYSHRIRLGGSGGMCGLGAIQGEMSGAHSIFSVEIVDRNNWSVRLRTQGTSYMTVNCIVFR